MPDPTATRQAAIEARIGSAQRLQCGSSTCRKTSERLASNLSAVIMRTLSKNSALMASKRVHGSNYRSKKFEA
jgi:hypothetical protein